MTQFPKVTRTVVVNNPQGFHMRPAHQFVQRAKEFQSQIYVIKGDKRCDGRSIMELLTLVAPQGTQLTIEAQGPDAQQAVEVLAQIVAQVFPEDEQDEAPPPSAATESP